MRNILTILGTRPEAIKLAPVILELRKYPNQLVSHVCATAQHRHMLDQVLTLFEIEVDYDLGLMRPNQTLFDLTASGITEIGRIIAENKPDLILVQGDTTTAFLAGLAAFYSNVRIGHVEAGLRTGDKRNPFPEEINRRMISILSDFHFAPTSSSRDNLIAENIPADHIFVTGNTVIDALFDIVQKDIPLKGHGLDNVNLNKRIILVTAHRRETFGQHIREICRALLDLAMTIDDIEIVYPVHLNPNIKETVRKIIGNTPNVHLVEPLEYGVFVSLMNKCHLILTDSGGIQEEAPSLGKPVLVLREITERPEAVQAGTVKVVGRSREKIVKETKLLLGDQAVYNRMAHAINPYGDGEASCRIVDHIAKVLNGQ